MSTKAEEFLENFLQHKYDPVKAREYYLRTRKLKGRRKAAAQPTGGRPEPAAVVVRSKGPPKQSANQKQALAAARVAAIQKRLDALKEVLAQLVEQAKKRSGVETKPDPKKKEAAKKDDKPKTAAEKKKDAKAQKERREKEERLSPDQKVAAIQKEMAQVREKIAEIRAQMAKTAKRPQPTTSKPDPDRDQTPGTKPPTAR